MGTAVLVGANALVAATVAGAATVSVGAATSVAADVDVAVEAGGAVTADAVAGSTFGVGVLQAAIRKPTIVRTIIRCNLNTTSLASECLPRFPANGITAHRAVAEHVNCRAPCILCYLPEVHDGQRTRVERRFS
jgi:hypothetical protein